MNTPYQIEAVAPGTSNAIRSHDHPILESGNLSFPEGRYLLDLQPGVDRSSWVITHQVEGAPLVSRLLEEQKARYACIVSSPISSYRKTHISKNPRHEVRWNVDDLGEAPLFTPVILSSGRQELMLSADRDGVHLIWDRQPVTLHKGSRLALGSVIQIESSILHLLSFHADVHLEEGQLAVELETEPFRFRVNLHPALHRFLRVHRGNFHHNVMTHIVTACLAKLQRDYADDDGDSGWRTHRNLIALTDYLEHKGLDHWSEEGFRPETVATAMYPLKFPEASPGESEDGETA